MFGYCKRHPSIGYQYFDSDLGRPLCISDIVEEEQEKGHLGTKNLSQRYPLIHDVHDSVIRQMEQED